MAGVLEQLFRPQRKTMGQKVMELEAVREILYYLTLSGCIR